MGLIDADVLMTDVRNTITEKSRAFDWINLINRQPTAYDVDKVVERLEEEKNPNYREDGSLMGERSVIEIDKAIEIVKTGGNI
jgi:hypothetical protein|nr:MAG TPA: hypothetical protein [Caudoviricetes sp.]